MRNKISEVKDLSCGAEVNEDQLDHLNTLAMLEFTKPKQFRTTPYLLVKKVKRRK